jgi:SAM-dependent methyltransferase
VTDQERILWSLERHGRRYNDWLLARLLPLGSRVLEVGAGIGTFTVPLAERGLEVIAIEPEPELARVLEERVRDFPNVTVRRDDVLELTVGMLGGPVDSVVCLNVLEHIPEDGRALARMQRCLRPGGHLLLLSPAHQFLYGETDRAVDHERRYDVDGLRELLRRAGFEVEDLRHVNPVGAVGWLVSSRLLKRRTLPEGPLSVFGRLVPILRVLDSMRLPFGLSLWANARAIRPVG